MAKRKSIEARVSAYAESHNKQETARYERQLNIQAEYKKAAHRVNQNMARIEKAVSSGRDMSGEILKWGYAAGQELAKKQGMTKGRLTESIPMMSIKDMTARLREVQQIEEMKSASLSGWKQTYKDRAATTNARYDTDLSADDIASLYEEGAGAFFKDKLNAGSKTVMKVIGQIQAQKDDVKQYFAKQRRSHHKLDPVEIASAIKDVNGYSLANDVSKMSNADQIQFRKFMEAIAKM